MFTLEQVIMCILFIPEGILSPWNELNWLLSVLKTYVYGVSLQAEGLWMSSSKEILLFRRILFNPVTCTQFQHFVSLRGDFLENDVLFWLEVQRYKVKGARISRGYCAGGSHGVTAMTPLLYASLLSPLSPNIK